MKGKSRKSSRFRAAIVGVSGYGGGEALRILAHHPSIEVVKVAGESSAGQVLGDRFPGLPPEIGNLRIESWEPSQLDDIDLLVASLPSGDSSSALARVPAHVRVVDIGGDHRFKPGWTYGLADLFADEIASSTRVANPGCYPSAALLALAPLLRDGLVDPSTLLIDAKSGISGAGRGGGSTFGFAEVNEDVTAYGLLRHPHSTEIDQAIQKIVHSDTATGRGVVFTPHLVPMTRGILATCYARGTASTADCMASAMRLFRDSPFVRVSEQPPHTKWAYGANFAFVSYAADPDRGVVIALCAIDNLGKGAAGQAVQNANLMLGLPCDAGLLGAPVRP
jgi:N-acetyl-gamma-glutamyl-phosphate reductase